ncbi:MAG: hypothetical protein ACOZNI_17655 [Myxococcota bacterium]
MFLLLAGCQPTPPLADEPYDADADTDTDADTDADTGPATFADDVYLSYKQSCDDCHERWGGTDADRVYDYVTTGEKDGIPLVVPGDPAASLLYSKVADEEPLAGLFMPLQSRALSDGDVEELEQWILDGANEDGTFQSIARQFDEHDCSECHSDWIVSLYDTLLTREVEGWTLIVPGSPEESLYYLKVNGGEPPVGVPMPLIEPSLSEDQVAAIGEWITNGATRD